MNNWLESKQIDNSLPISSNSVHIFLWWILTLFVTDSNSCSTIFCAVYYIIIVDDIFIIAQLGISYNCVTHNSTSKFKVVGTEKYGLYYVFSIQFTRLHHEWLLHTRAYNVFHYYGPSFLGQRFYRLITWVLHLCNVHMYGVH